MLQLDDDGQRRWFPPSAPPLTPPSPLEGFGANRWEEREFLARPPPVPAFLEPPQPPSDFQQYPGAFYGTVPPPRPPVAFVARPVHDRPLTFHRSVDISTGRSSYSLGWAFSAMARFMLLLLFNGANGVLALVGAAAVWAGVLLSIAMLPLCGFGIVLFHTMMNVACYICQADVVLHNVVADADHKIRFPRPTDEYESLLPIRATRPGRSALEWGEQGVQSSLRFEKTLHEPSPRAVLAIIYLTTVAAYCGGTP